MKKAATALLILATFNYIYGANYKYMTNIQEEIWKDIPQFVGKYQASNLGRIKSLARKENSNRNFITPERILTHDVGKFGYNRVIFDNRKKYLVHRLVMSAFEPIESYLQVNHKNGNKSDNRLINLEWCTQSENTIHAITGLNRKVLKGAEVGNSKLTNEDVYAIRLAYKVGIGDGPTIQKEYYPHVSYGTISDIISRRRWRHI